MVIPMIMTRKIRDENEMCDLAKCLAPHLGAGDVILLSGEIGAGKSVFARAVIHAILGAEEEVPSPSFTLVQTYEAVNYDIWHCDFYRLDNPDHILELGLEEAFETALCLIEWPERMGDFAPQAALNIAIDVGPSQQMRDISLRWDSPHWNRIMGQFDGSH